jgi:thiosulfate dehydrogenase (quinone) large subunit
MAAANLYGIASASPLSEGANAEAFVAYGVTSLRDPGGALSWLNAMQDQSELTSNAVPRYFYSGKIFEGEHPIWGDGLVSLGLNICLHGVVRWAAGLRSFAQSLVPMFEKTILPPWSVYSFGVMLPVLEAVIGAAVLVGFNSRCFLTFGCSDACLDVGSALRQDWQTVGIQLIYSVVYCILLAGVPFNSYNVDRAFRGLI